jgi:hypothetical protein
MADLRQISKTIGLGEYMNALLVHKGVRPAMLLEVGEYIRDYRHAQDPDIQRKALAKMNSVADALQLRFPDLKCLNYRNGIFISRTLLSEANVRTPANVGHVLGFFCADDFNYLDAHLDTPSYFIEIVVHLTPGYDTQVLQLISNICRSTDTLESMNTLAETIYSVLKTDPIVGPVVSWVEARAFPRKTFLDSWNGGARRRVAKQTRKVRRR